MKIIVARTPARMRRKGVENFGEPDSGDTTNVLATVDKNSQHIE